MTSNQVSYQVGTETVTETKRHNVETEKVAKQLADLEETKLQFQDDWKRVDQYIQAKYNDAYIDYLNSGLDEKTAHDKAQDDIAQQKADNDAYYNILMGEVNKDLKNIKAMEQSELVRHNKELEKWNSSELWLKEKNLQYQQSATLLQSSIQEAQLAFEQYKTELNAELERSKQLLSLNQAQLNAERDLAQMQQDASLRKTSIIADTTTGIVSGFLRAFGLRSLNSGGSYGTNSKQTTEQKTRKSSK